MNVYPEQEQSVGRDFEAPAAVYDTFVFSDDHYEFIVKRDYAGMSDTTGMLSRGPAVEFAENETGEFHFMKRSCTLHNTLSHDAKFSRCPPIDIPDFDMEADVNMDL